MLDVGSGNLDSHSSWYVDEVNSTFLEKEPEMWKSDEKKGWGTKFGMMKSRTTDIPEFQNYEY